MTCSKPFRFFFVFFFGNIRVKAAVVRSRLIMLTYIFFYLKFDKCMKIMNKAVQIYETGGISHYLVL